MLLFFVSNLTFFAESYVKLHYTGKISSFVTLQGSVRTSGEVDIVSLFNINWGSAKFDGNLYNCFKITAKNIWHTFCGHCSLIFFPVSGTALRPLAMRFKQMYTVFHKTTPYLIVNNFGKCWPIFKKFSPSDSAEIA